jgi:glycosyltransferase involved in cell wall biosynthesis
MSIEALREREPAPARRHSPAPVVEIVVPVYNEAATLERSIRRLHAFLETSLPFRSRIVIADNASTDATWAIATGLRDELSEVEAIHLELKGRGRALRAAWSASDAEVLCYMDVDLSTDLQATLPLIAALVSGHSDVAIGTRLAPGSRIVRSRKRELISRTYNRLLRLALRARFSDAQCGFKAIRADAAKRLLPEVADEEWFFDTELLVQAQRHGMRIHEVPVDWIEDPDSRVDIIRTSLADLRGVARLSFALPIVRFLAIGVISTVAYALLYLLLRGWLGAALANALALGLTALGNTHANRRYTFGVRGRDKLVRHHLAGVLVFLLALALTEGALRFLNAVAPHAPAAVEVVVLVLASAAATISRYVALRSCVFARDNRASITRGRRCGWLRVRNGRDNDQHALRIEPRAPAGTAVRP